MHRLLLLRILCFFTGPWLGWRRREENRLRFCSPGVDCYNNYLLPCKFVKEQKQNLQNTPFETFTEIDRLIECADTCKVHIRAYSPWLTTFEQEHTYSLDYLD